jgi:hemoglobin
MHKKIVKKKDIETQADIVLLVDTFYQKVSKNEILGFIFNDVAKVDWPGHLPKMYSFWGSMLLGERTYTGDPMATHMELSKQTAMCQPQFTAWINLFTATVDELFEGEKAREAKLRATNVAGFMLHKVQVAV